MINESDLQDFGLNKNEAKIYLFLLKRGPSKVNDIYEGTKIQRTFIYEILKNLLEKGVVSYVVKSGVKFFEASGPEKIKDNLKEKLDLFEKYLPELKQIKAIPKEKPSVEIYEGKEGLKSILNLILKMPKESQFLAYANNDLFEKLRFYFPNFVRQRIKNRIYAKIIQQKTKQLEESKKNDKKELRELKFSKITFQSSVFIWKENVAFITLKEEEFMGVLIKNKVISETQKQVFEILWNVSN
jgi:HTH-type transcriptional regulator, sugar sensing transcriptional regulator